jgi:hypothetical protein
MRCLAAVVVVGCALALPYASQAAGSSTHVRAATAQAAPSQASGTIMALGASWFTIQTSGRRTGVVNAMVAAANAVTRSNYPYVWGGGHPEAGVASASGRKRRVGFDCSGSVAAVLAGAGVWPAGSPVPNDAAVISQLLRAGLIARGPGRGPVEVTLYDHPSVHIFMNIDGRFFGTSDGGGGGSAKGGPGWLGDGAPDAHNRAFKQYHLLASVLKDRTSYGHALTFQTATTPSLLYGTAVGDRVTVSYTPSDSGTMTASAIAYPGAVTTSGTVTAIAPNGTSVTVQVAGGSSLTFSANPELINGLGIGDQIQVTYTTSVGNLIARALTVTASAQPAAGTPTGSGDPSAGAGPDSSPAGDGADAGSGPSNGSDGGGPGGT